MPKYRNFDKIGALELYPLHGGPCLTNLTQWDFFMLEHPKLLIYMMSVDIVNDLIAQIIVGEEDSIPRIFESTDFLNF